MPRCLQNRSYSGFYFNIIINELDRESLNRLSKPTIWYPKEEVQNIQAENTLLTKSNKKVGEENFTAQDILKLQLKRAII